MTYRDGTPIPWGSERMVLSAPSAPSAPSAATDAHDDPPIRNASDPLDDLCDALCLKPPRGRDRLKARDALVRLIAEAGRAARRASIDPDWLPETDDHG